MPNDKYAYGEYSKAQVLIEGADPPDSGALQHSGSHSSLSRAVAYADRFSNVKALCTTRLVT